MMAKFTCPHCYQVYSASAVRYLCPDCNTIARKSRKKPVKCSSRGCGGLATTRLCPMCMVDKKTRVGTNDIPKIALETPNLLFSIVGVSTSGKTNYITVMLDELMNFSDIRLAMGDQTNETGEHQRNNMMKIRRGEAPEGTFRGQVMPQIWYIKNLQKKYKKFFGAEITPTYTFTIYDGAGEDHTEMDPTMVRYIKTSEAFIIVLDPLVLEGVKSFADPKIISNSYKDDSGQGEIINSTQIVGKLANTLRTIKGLKAGTVLKMPVAVVLTKIDTVLNHPAFANCRVKSPSLNMENGKVREEEFEQLHGEIENWLRVVGEQKFINALDANFATSKNRYYNFFAVSSYGKPPEEQGTVPDKIKPHRVLDPILWLFKKKKFID